MGEKVRLYFCIFVVLYISHQTQLVEAGTLYIYIFFLEVILKKHCV